MKKFNLEKALDGNPVVTRSGKKVIALYPIKEFSDVKDRMDLFVVIEGKDKNVDWGWSHQNGCQQKDGQGEYGFDLFMAPKITLYWSNAYKMKNNDEILLTHAFDSEELAKRNITDSNEYHNYLKTISFEIED